MRRTTGTLIASAAAALIIAGVAPVRADDRDKKAGGDVMCEGVNDCRGKSVCATATTTCSGKNDCKGQGSILVPNEQQCQCLQQKLGVEQQKK